MLWLVYFKWRMAIILEYYIGKLRRSCILSSISSISPLNTVTWHTWHDQWRFVGYTNIARISLGIQCYTADIGYWYVFWLLIHRNAFFMFHGAVYIVWENGYYNTVRCNNYWTFWTLTPYRFFFKQLSVIIQYRKRLNVLMLNTN